MTESLKRNFDMENRFPPSILSRFTKFLRYSVFCCLLLPLQLKIKNYFHYLPKNSCLKFDVDIPITQYSANA